MTDVLLVEKVIKGFSDKGEGHLLLDTSGVKFSPKGQFWADDLWENAAVRAHFHQDRGACDTEIKVMALGGGRKGQQALVKNMLRQQFARG